MYAFNEVILAHTLLRRDKLLRLSIGGNQQRVQSGAHGKV